MFHELRLSMEALAYSPKCPGFAKNIIYKVRLKSLRSGHITIMPSGGRVHLEPCACHGGPAVNQGKLIASEKVFVIDCYPREFNYCFNGVAHCNGPCGHLDCWRMILLMVSTFARQHNCIVLDVWLLSPINDWLNFRWILCTTVLTWSTPLQFSDLSLCNDCSLLELTLLSGNLKSTKSPYQLWSTTPRAEMRRKSSTAATSLW